MLPHNGFRMRSSLSSFGGWWGRWESTGSLPRTDTTLSEECVCHEVVHVVVAVGHYAVLFCAVQRWQNGVMSGFMITRIKKTSRTKRQNIWHHPHVHHSPPSSNYSLIPRRPERKGRRTRNRNGGIGWRCIYDHQLIAVCKVYLFKKSLLLNEIQDVDLGNTYSIDCATIPSPVWW